MYMVLLRYGICEVFISMNLQENIRKVLREDSLKNSLIDDIKNDGWFSVSEYVGGDENLKRITGIHNSQQFMKLFSDIEPKQSEEDSDTILYKNDKGVNVFLDVYGAYDDEEYWVMVNYDLIYKPLGLFLETKGYGKKIEVLQKWLRNEYNIKVNEWTIDYYLSGDKMEYLN